MYCTAEDIRGELYLPSIKQMETRFGTGFDAFLEGHAVKAEDYINAQLAGRFPVPFQTPPYLGDPRRNIPARPYLGVSDRGMRVIVAMINQAERAGK
ncbi:hypothetical protein [Dethiosulfovibrio salsuginis]|uniref:Uncharacterized protein n=1 Tax=Dethiosulfovibrio salsuginis TaxID=561720 RepID=A0A1X7LEC0_9BACT|nr:hypothetical protein [Dethiosulfovibrio salsuginis]SMG51723.1 hypothetical protein SAMN06275492_15712 [Dethiosulfovibrio salsuginis]